MDLISPFPELPMPDFLLARERAAADRQFATAEEQLRFVIELAMENVRHGGGPFAAAVFRPDQRLVSCQPKLFAKTETLVSAAVNQVLQWRQSFAHAETVAILRAETRLGSGTLSGLTVVSSCEPCIMCQGAVLWSKVAQLIYGAPGRAAIELGFDEGDKAADWQDGFRRRGIAVTGPLLEAEAAEPFRLYRESGGRIY